MSGETYSDIVFQRDVVFIAHSQLLILCISQLQVTQAATNVDCLLLQMLVCSFQLLLTSHDLLKFACDCFLTLTRFITVHCQLCVKSCLSRHVHISQQQILGVKSYPHLSATSLQTTNTWRQVTPTFLNSITTLQPCANKFHQI